jgi:hypothetical protein
MYRNIQQWLYNPGNMQIPFFPVNIETAFLYGDLKYQGVRRLMLENALI